MERYGLAGRVTLQDVFDEQRKELTSLNARPEKTQRELKKDRSKFPSPLEGRSVSGQAARAEKRRKRRAELRAGPTASRASGMQECFGFDLESLRRIGEWVPVRQPWQIQRLLDDSAV
jgi:hypothetical protein